jgi:hypothetical protein
VGHKEVFPRVGFGFVPGLLGEQRGFIDWQALKGFAEGLVQAATGTGF